MQKVREAPTQLKRKAKSFLKKLRRYGVKLDDSGDLDLSDVQEDNVRKYLEKNASLVRLTLMQADLEFEYPQKLEKMKIQADVYQLAVKEDEKLKFADFAKDAAEARKKVLTYEEYFQLDPTKDGQPKPKAKKGFTIGQSSKGGTTYDEFRAQRESANMFENDLLDLEYKFWESQEDKELRIKQLWIELKKKRALRPASEQRKATEEQNELNREIVELTRRVRWRVDQELARKNVEPIFKENYYSYTKREFLLDAEFEFVKVKNLLDKSPRLLKEDPVLSIDYLKIVNLIKQKKLLEMTTDHYDPTATVDIHYHDIQQAEIIAEKKRLASIEQAAKSIEDAESQVSNDL